MNRGPGGMEWHIVVDRNVRIFLPFSPLLFGSMSQSQQNLDQGNTATSSSSASRSLPMNRRRKPSRTPSDTEKELLAQYMDKVLQYIS